jgi:hypothetical protein
MLTPLLALWAVSTAQLPDTAAGSRRAATLHALDDSLAAVQAAAFAFRADLGTASSDLVFARARRLHERCAAARRTAQSLAVLLVGTPPPPSPPSPPSPRAAERRARRDLAELERVLQKCERDYDPATPGANADTLKAWGPFRLSQFDIELRRYARGVRELQGAPATR